MSSRLQVELFEIVVQGGRLKRYIKSLNQTFNLIRTKKPKVIIAQNPSIVLGYFLLILRKVYGYSLISDSHLGGIQAYNENRLFQRVLDFFNSKADLVIVTTEGHAERCHLIGGRPYVCQDPLPVLPESEEIKNNNFDKSIFFICSFDIDEPFDQVWEAFDILEKQGFSLFVSGNYKKAKIDIYRFSKIHFLGFIPEKQFYGYLKQCSLVLDLTTWDNCLVCGAYEALSAGKPLVLSQSTALKSYFSPAAVFTDHTPESIAKNILYAYENRNQLTTAVRQWVIDNEKKMVFKIGQLQSLISSMRDICSSFSSIK